MAGDEKKKGTHSDEAPSADEIIEALALEMGVNDKKAGEAQPAPTPAAEEKVSDQKKKPSGDPMADLGGIFEVPAASAKKTTQKAKDVAGEAKAAAHEQTQKAAQKARAAAVAGEDAVGSLFNVSGKASDEPREAPPTFDPDDDKDLEKLERKAGGGTNRLLIGVIVALVLAMGAILILNPGSEKSRVDDLGAVFDGTYRDKKDAEKRRIEEEHLKQQREALEKYGALNIIGEPDKAVIKLQLEGETEPRIIYATTGSEGVYSELRLPTTIQNIKIKKPFAVRVEAPGYRPQTINITQDRWIETSVGDFQYQLAVYLDPESVEAREELADRMLPFDKDGEEDGIVGTIKVDSNPPGAQIKLDGRLVVDDAGKPLLTPTTLDRLMPKPVEEGDKKDAKKDERKPIQVNVPHHKVEVFWPEDQKRPSYVTGVFRNLWACAPKDEKDLNKLPKDARASLKCNYEYTVNADFTGIDAEIRRIKAIQEELLKEKEKLDALRKQQEELEKK
jgi:hypothetical protein